MVLSSGKSGIGSGHMIKFKTSRNIEVGVDGIYRGSGTSKYLNGRSVCVPRERVNRSTRTFNN